MNRLAHALLTIAIAGFMFGGCSTPRTTVKFMSYNIRNGRGMDNVQDLGRIAEVIKRAAPDIVALQELDSMTTRNERVIIAELSQLTGMHATFGRAIDYAGGAYGVGLLSRSEPLSVRRVALPGREEARVLLMAEFPEYVVCVTHLSLTREDQLASLPLIHQATDTCRKPVLLAGDFNIKQASAVQEGLGSAFRFLSDTTQLTHPSTGPKIRIDYLLGHGLPQSVKITDPTIDYTTTASDHCPLWVTLSW